LGGAHHCTLLTVVEAASTTSIENNGVTSEHLRHQIGIAGQSTGLTR